MQKPGPSDLEKKHKDTFFEFLSNYKNGAVVLSAFSTVAALAGFVLKSAALRRMIVKRNLVRTKDFNLKTTTHLNLIPRLTIFQAIFQAWNIIANEEGCSQPIILIEGYQGIGKSFLIQWFIQEQSKVRPTQYISLREINLAKWEEIIGEQIHYLPENFPLSSSIVDIFLNYILF